MPPQPVANTQKFAHISDAEFTEQYIQQGRSGRETAKYFGMSPAAARMRCSRLGLEPDPRPKSVGKDLKEIQLDPAYEARRALQAIREGNEADFELYANRTICRECGEFMSCLNATGEHSHLRKHFPECGTNKERAMVYQNRYPGAPLQSPASNSGCRQLKKRWRARNELTGYLKKLASGYVTADELRGRRTDLRERPGEDFWVCLNCGRKIFSDPYVHIAAEGYDVDSYRAKWGLVRISTPARRAIGRKVSKGQRERMQAHMQALAAKAWLPDDWADWREDERLIFHIVRENPSVKPREVALRLDESRFACPFRGGSWHRAITRPGSAATWMTKILKIARDKIKEHEATG